MLMFGPMLCRCHASKRLALPSFDARVDLLCDVYCTVAALLHGRCTAAPPDCATMQHGNCFVGGIQGPVGNVVHSKRSYELTTLNEMIESWLYAILLENIWIFRESMFSNAHQRQQSKSWAAAYGRPPSLHNRSEYGEIFLRLFGSLHSLSPWYSL